MNFSIENRLVGTKEKLLLIYPFIKVFVNKKARNYLLINFMRNRWLHGQYFGLIQIDSSVTADKTKKEKPSIKFNFRFCTISKIFDMTNQFLYTILRLSKF